MSIAKIKTNHSARATIQYVINKTGTQVIGGNVAPWIEHDQLTDTDIDKIVASSTRMMQFSISLNQRVKRPIYHISLSFHPDEDQDDEALSEYCEKYLAALILTADHPELLQPSQAETFRAAVEQFRERELPNYSYLIARHRDQEHPHAHIVCSRVNLETALTIPTSYERYRSQVILRDLEQQFGLTVQPNSWEVGRRAPSISQIEKGKQTQTMSVQQRLQDILERVAQSTQTVPEFMQQLQTEGVDVRVKFTCTGKSKGVSYSLDGVSLSGNALGTRYSFKHGDPGLVKHLGLSYLPERDNALIEALCQQPPDPAPINEPIVVDPMSDQEISQDELATSFNDRPGATSPVIGKTIESQADQVEREVQPDPIKLQRLNTQTEPEKTESSLPVPPALQEYQVFLTTLYALWDKWAKRQPRYDGNHYWMEWNANAAELRVGRQGNTDPFLQGQWDARTQTWKVLQADIALEDRNYLQALQAAWQNAKHQPPTQSAKRGDEGL